MIVNPVGDISSRVFPPAPHKISNAYLARYTLSGKATIHTGVDIDLPGAQDVDQPVRSIADGTVIYAKYLSTSTWLGLVVVKHVIDGRTLYTRYGHLRPPTVKKGEAVKAGDVIGQTSPTAGTVASGFPPHLHFDASKWDDPTMENTPTHWPGANEQSVRDHYQDPVSLMHSLMATGHVPAPNPLDRVSRKVLATQSLALRAWPSLDASILTRVHPKADVIAATGIIVEADGYRWTYVEMTSAWRGWVAAVELSSDAIWIEGF